MKRDVKDLICSMEAEIAYLQDVAKRLNKVGVIYFQLFQSENYKPLEDRYYKTFLDARNTYAKIKDFEKSTRLTVNELRKCL